MKTIKEDYKARAASFENDKDWKKYLSERLDIYDGCDDPEMIKMRDNVERNCYLIKYFADDLHEYKKLSDKTIQNHVDNVDFYLNFYTVEYLEDSAEEAMHESTLNSFMIDFFPRKALWCSMSAIKEMSASLVKFYKWMNENDLVDNKDFAEFRLAVKENKDSWVTKFKKREAYYDRMLQGGGFGDYFF